MGAREGRVLWWFFKDVNNMSMNEFVCYYLGWTG